MKAFVLCRLGGPVETILSIAGHIGLVSFALAALAYLWAFQQRVGGEKFEKLGFALLSVATITSVISYTYNPFSAERPLSAGLLLASILGALSIFIYWRFKAKIIGVFTSPVATLAILAQAFSEPPDRLVGTQLPPGLLQAHVLLAVCGEAFAIVAFAAACLLLRQQKVLKKKILSQMTETRPALDRLSSLLSTSVWIGFVLLTFGLITGTYVHKALGFDQGYRSSIQPKIVWAVCVWVWYLAILLARNALNWPSRKIAQMCVAGFVLMALSLFGLTPPWGQ